MNYEERQNDIDGIEDEIERCRECGSTEAGSCFYCKMD